ncbi:MAG: RidA family protein, partial [Acidobacteriaceae bacterium]
MKEPSRRSLIKNAAKVAVAAAGGSMLTSQAAAQTRGRLEKKGYPAGQPGKKQLFSSAVSYGNLLFLSGVGAHFKGTIEEHTQHVLDELQKNLASAGSSMEKVLKVNVYLN